MSVPLETGAEEWRGPMIRLRPSRPSRIPMIPATEHTRWPARTAKRLRRAIKSAAVPWRFACRSVLSSAWTRRRQSCPDRVSRGNCQTMRLRGCSTASPPDIQHCASPPATTPPRPLPLPAAHRARRPSTHTASGAGRCSSPGRRSNRLQSRWRRAVASRSRYRATAPRAIVPG